MIILLYFFIFLAIVLFIAIIIALFFLVVIVKGAPYIPTDKKKISTILDLAKVLNGQKVLDLGSGDGRLLIALARAGANCYGYEINPFLVWWSKYKIKKAGLENQAFIYKKDFWTADVSDFSLVVFFGSGNIMKKLEDKLQKELPIGAKVISNGFAFPNWPHIKKSGQLYLYQK